LLPTKTHAPSQQYHGGGSAKIGYLFQQCPSRQHINRRQPPKLPLHSAHVTTASPPLLQGTELPEDANRSIGWTYYVGTAGDGPYAAAGIVACNRIIIINVLCTFSQINSNKYCFLVLST
jgi:hypothetical protein